MSVDSDIFLRPEGRWGVTDSNIHQRSAAERSRPTLVEKIMAEQRFEEKEIERLTRELEAARAVARAAVKHSLVDTKSDSEIAALRERCGRLEDWAKANNLLDESGEPRKILGEVSVTADGAVVGHPFSAVFYVNRHGNVKPSTFYNRHFSRDCYSTREAAERAAKGG